MTRRTRRIAFALYAAALFIGTHIPRFSIELQTIDRPDLILHITAFGGWFILLLATELFGPWQSPRSIAICTLIAAAYAAVDEYSQALPFLHRTAAFDDLAANLAGVGLAALGALVASRLWRRPAAPTLETDPE